MKPEKQRIAIAEVCGWKKVSHQHSVDWEHWDKDGWFAEPPDYPNDLNAMHEAIRERIAGDQELEARFIKALHTIQDSIADSDEVTPICEHEMVDIISECSWLSEAFLRTIGKWEDE